jgi:flagellar biosynthesis chaperone FliJ
LQKQRADLAAEGSVASGLAGTQISELDARIKIVKSRISRLTKLIDQDANSYREERRRLRPNPPPTAGPTTLPH